MSSLIILEAVAYKNVKEISPFLTECRLTECNWITI